jgi:bacteriorhodopsin
MLLDLCGLAGAGQDTTLLLVILDVLMIVAGVIGAFIDSSTKYLFFAFGMLAFLPILYFLAVSLKAKAKAAGSNAAEVFNTASLLTIVTWSAYPVVWMLAEGTGALSPDTECIVYTILDITAKSVFGFLIVRARDGIGEIHQAAMAPLSGGYGATN